MRLQNPGQIIARRTLAVRANHMDFLELFLWVSEHLAKFTRRGEPRHHPEYKSRVQIFQSVLNHGS